MTTAPKAAHSIHGQKFALSTRGNLVSDVGVASIGEGQRRVNITHQGVIITGTISAKGASVANQRDIALQVKDATGRNVNAVTPLEIVVLLNAGGTDFAVTGGSTGIAAGSAGKLLAMVAKKLFKALTSASGALNIIYTDTGTEACHLGIIMPSGDLVVAGVLT